jgi:superoxide dismutase, Cu-Zn family
MTKRINRWLGVALCAAAWAACAPANGEPNAAPQAAAADEQRTARADLIGRQGQPIGTATLTQHAHGVEIAVEVRDLPPGVLGFHVHEDGRCDAPSFESAGGHFAPHGRSHGMEHPSGPHAGDLPNLRVGDDGSARLAVLNPHLTLRDGAGSLLGGTGTALIIHEGRDDYHSQPTGDAGDRLACGVIRAG